MKVRSRETLFQKDSAKRLSGLGVLEKSGVQYFWNGEERLLKGKFGRTAVEKLIAGLKKPDDCLIIDAGKAGLTINRGNDGKLWIEITTPKVDAIAQLNDQTAEPLLSLLFPDGAPLTQAETDAGLSGLDIPWEMFCGDAPKTPG